MWWLVLSIGCRHLGGWDVQRGATQSTTGSLPFVTVHAEGAATSGDLMIACAPGGLELSYRGRFPESGATVRFDEAPPVVLPTEISERGEPVVDLQERVDGGTVEELLVSSTRLSVLSEEPPRVDVFDVTEVGRALRRLRCPRAR